jgi:putative ABC transport system substrate-binding protein
MTDRRTFVRVMAAGLLVAPLSAAGASENSVRRVGWLHLGQPWNLHHFRDKLRELGWIEGRNLVIDARFADNEVRRLPALAAELVQLRVDVIVTQSTPAAIAAKDATSVIPIVMAGSNNPEANGLVGSLARPGGNVTGVTNNPGTAFGAKIVQMLKEAAPRVSRLAVLDRSGAGGHPSETSETAALDVAVIKAIANTQAEVPTALAAALRQRADGLFIPSNPVNEAEKKWLAEFALTHSLPAIGGSKDLVSAGILMSYWADWGDIRRQAAVYVDKILKGADPGELPVERPSTFELAINLSTARSLRLTIPHALMLRADELFA